MRKAAYILGTICVVLSLVGAVLKLNSLPGGGTLMVLFTSLFSVGAMPLFLYALSKVETEKAMQFAIRLCGFSFAALQVGLLFYAQRWPDPTSFIYAGLLGQTVFVVVFLLNMRKPEVKTKRLSMFAFLPMIILGVLGVSGFYAKEKVVLSDDALQRYALALTTHDALLTEVTQLENKFQLDTSNEVVMVAATDLILKSHSLLTTIENLRRALMSELNQNDNFSNEDEFTKLAHPEEVDMITLRMVGENVEYPDGRGSELFDVLLHYRVAVLHPAVSFSVPVKAGDEFRDQWVKDNFYQYPAVEVFIRLLMIEQAILLAEKDAMSEKLFIET